MQRRGSCDGLFLGIFFLLVTGLTTAGFIAKRWLPMVASRHAPGVDRMISYLLMTTGVVFVVGHLVLAVFLFRYQGDGPAPFRPVRRRTEVLWALIPVLVMTLIAEAGVLILGRPVWAQVYGEPPQDALVVEVVGKQFEWMVRYPGRDGAFGGVKPELVRDANNPVGLDESDLAAKDDLVFRAALRLPVGRHVVLRLRSQDVLHSFSIPEFRVKQDVIPGYTGTTQFLPNKIGTYEIACAELCGLGHYKMRGFVHVMPEEEFKKWMETQIGWFE